MLEGVHPHEPVTWDLQLPSSRNPQRIFGVLVVLVRVAVAAEGVESGAYDDLDVEQQ